jgi:hypothetical protein
MRMSGVLIGLGLVLVVSQFAASDGGPLAELVGILPLLLGSLALLIGVAAGLLRGVPRYRIAVLLGLLGAPLLAFGLFFMSSRNPSAPDPLFTINEVALFVGAACWISAIVLGVQSIRAPQNA